MGVSAVLLICSVLEDGRLKAYHQLADESGISTPEQAAKMCQSADGAIVGSAIVKLCEKYGKDCVLANGNECFQAVGIHCNTPFDTNDFFVSIQQNNQFYKYYVFLYNIPYGCIINFS